jgi:PAS domain-containing protein
MRQKEEELRQNMEEMRTTQEEMHRHETELAAVNYETEQLQNMMLVTSMLITISPDGTITEVNDNLLNAFEGATREDIVGKPVELWIGKQDYDAMMDNCKRGEAYEMVAEMATGPNRVSIFRRKFVPICDKAGHLLRVMMIANDETHIEEMHRREAELAAANFEMDQYIQAIFKTCNVVVSSPDGTVIDINDRLLNMFGGAPREAFVGKPMSAFTGEESFKKIWADMRKGKIHENTQQVDTGVGGVITYRQRFVPICDRSGKLLKVFELTDPE